MGECSAARVLVFDVGGSHASAALARGGSLSATSTSPVDSEGSAEAILHSLEELGRKVLSQGDVECGGLSGVSFGFPNPFDYEAGISYIEHKYAQLYGRNLRSEFAARFGVPASSVTFVNDASAYLLGEIHFGAAAGVERVIGITLGTGVGSAFAVRGQIVTRGEGVPNEGFLWNVPYQDSIVEDYISTRAVRKLFKALSGEDIEVREIAERAATDAKAAMAMRQFGEALGIVLNTVCGEFRPDAVVLGGAISRSAHLFIPAAQAQLGATGVRLLVSRLFDDAALLGAFVGWEIATGAATKAVSPRVGT